MADNNDETPQDQIDDSSDDNDSQSQDHQNGSCENDSPRYQSQEENFHEQLNRNTGDSNSQSQDFGASTSQLHDFIKQPGGDTEPNDDQ